MKKQVLLILLVLNFLSVFAQGKITGRIADANTGETLTGVSIKIMGTNQKTLTDTDGNFIFHI